jgi:hypothetical protein
MRGIATGGALAAFPALLGCAPAPSKKASPGSAASVAPGAVIMVIRHGEKPAKTDTNGGLDLTGQPDIHSLTTQGWTRAAYLVDLFATDSAGRARLPRPYVIYASGQGKGDGEGTRPRETVGPLAAALDIPVDTTFSRGQETELAQRAAGQAGQAGPTLICWQHESIPAIGAAFAPASPTPPISWPDEVYDRVWVFTAGSGGWRFDDVPQMLLPGDTK